MSLLTRHFWKFFFGLVALIACGILIIYIASLFDGAEADVQTENNRAYSR